MKTKYAQCAAKKKTIVKFTDEENEKFKKLKVDQIVENKIKIYKECSRQKLMRLLGKGTIVLENDVFIYVDSKDPVQNLWLKEKFDDKNEDGEEEDGEEEDGEAEKGEEEEIGEKKNVSARNSGTYASDDEDMD